jgi:hypothetical protein
LSAQSVDNITFNPMLFSRRFPLFVVALFLGLLSVQLACGFGAGSSQPSSAVATRIAPAPTEKISVPMPLSPQGAPTVPEMRVLTLEFPPVIRAGDSDVITLTLEVDEQGNLTPTVSSVGNVTRSEVVSIPNVYETHNVLAEARLDMAGVEIRPTDMVSQPLLPGQPVKFFWSVRPAEVGKYRGTVWCFLHFVPKTNGQESRQALSAQIVEVDATALFGIQAGPARWFGVVGTFVSSLLGLPFLESTLKWLWKKIRAAKG